MASTSMSVCLPPISRPPCADREVMCSAFRQRRPPPSKASGARRERAAAIPSAARRWAHGAGGGGGGAAPFGRAALAQGRGGLGERFAAQLPANPAYHQIRLIGATDGRREIARTDRMGPGNAIRVAPEAELQPRGDRDYFQRAMRLRAGEVDISPVELDREHGAIDAPHVPVVRASTPVVAPDGRPFWIVVIDIDLRGPFARTREDARPGGAVYIVNTSGDYLVHPDPAREFGFQLGAPARLQDDFPALAGMLAGGRRRHAR